MTDVAARQGTGGAGVSGETPLAGLARPPGADPDGQHGEASAPPAWLRSLTDVVRTMPSGHFRLAPRLRQPAGVGRPSAVLMLFGPGSDGGTDVLLTERASGLRSHAGQVSFPGGRVDPHDAGPVEAALREANEEVGLDPAGVASLAELPVIDLAVSSSLVTPVLAWWSVPSPVWARSPREVAAVRRVPVAELCDPGNRLLVHHRPSGHEGPAFEVGGLFVWGFTAALLDKVIELGGLERPWDRARVRPAPVPPAFPQPRPTAGGRP